MMCVMLVTEPGVPGRLITAPIRIACDKYWIFCGVMQSYTIYVSLCALRAAPNRMNDIRLIKRYENWTTLLVP